MGYSYFFYSPVLKWNRLWRELFVKWVTFFVLFVEYIRKKLDKGFFFRFRSYKSQFCCNFAYNNWKKIILCEPVPRFFQNIIDWYSCGSRVTINCGIFRSGYEWKFKCLNLVLVNDRVLKNFKRSLNNMPIQRGKRVTGSDKECVRIYKHLENSNREDSYTLPDAWKPILQHKKTPSLIPIDI